MLADPPDLLLTTPESLESMLVSTGVDHQRLFADLRAVIVDEVHAFGAGDRGWHLLAVLERLTRIAGRPLQRIGLSATVGNPAELLTWLQGSAAGQRTGIVVAPQGSGGCAAGRDRSGESKAVTDACPQRTRTFSWTTSGAWRTPPRSSRRCTGARSAWSSATPSGSSRSSARSCASSASPRT